MFYNYVDISKNKKIMKFFIKKIENHEDLVKSMNRFYKKTSYFAFFKNMSIPVCITSLFGVLSYFLINNGVNTLSLEMSLALLFSPALLSIVCLKIQNYKTIKLKEKIIDRIKELNILDVSEEDFTEWKYIFSEKEFSFLIDLIKEENVSPYEIIESIRTFESTKNDKTLSMLDEKSQTEIEDYLVKKENYINEQLNYYQNKKELLLKKKELITSINNKGE